MWNERGIKMENVLLNEELENEEIELEETDLDEAETEESNSNESRNEKFMRIAEFRVNKMVDWIRKIDNLSNRGNYEYTDEQVEEIFGYIQLELDEVKKHFLSSGKKDEKKFKFGAK